MSSTRTTPSLAPPEYLSKVVQTSARIDLKFYSAALGLSSHLKRISPEVDSTTKCSRVISSIVTPVPFTDPPIIRSEEWPASYFTKYTEKQRWTQFKTKTTSCIKSVQFRFAALGFLLGLLVSLGALIPILLLWIRTNSASTTTLSATAPTSGVSYTLVGFGFNVTSAVPQCANYYCQEVVIFNSNMTISALSLNITIQRTQGETFVNAFDTYSSITNNCTIDTNVLSCYFTVYNNSLPAGNYTYGVGFNIQGDNHTASLDTYSITATNLCGVTQTTSGTF